MSNALSKNWQHTTICIESDLGEIAGTGVLIADLPTTTAEHGAVRVTWEKPTGRVYLATARHVLGENKSVISTTLQYTLRYTSSGPTGLSASRADFTIQNDPPNWMVHPDPDIDIAVLDLTDWIQTVPDALLRFCPLSELANPTSLMHVHCDAGDDVFVLGYPLTLRQGQTNLPIFRKGVLATSPRRALEDNGKPLRGFLVDGAIMPGSSGSPVISLSTSFRSGDLAVTPSRTLLLGIVAQEWGRGELARYDSAHKVGAIPIEGYANLGFAHSASAIIETIILFGHYNVHNFLSYDHDQHWSAALGVEEWALEFTGREVDERTAERIMLRLHRDRMRDRDYFVEPDGYLDIPELLGPVRKQTPSGHSPYIAGSPKASRPPRP